MHTDIYVYSGPNKKRYIHKQTDLSVKMIMEVPHTAMHPKAAGQTLRLLFYDA